MVLQYENSSILFKNLLTSEYAYESDSQNIRKKTATE
jgi:hypothetical protein